MKREQADEYLSAKDRKALKLGEAELRARFVKLLPRKQLGENADFHATILAETWATLRTMSLLIERVSKESDFVAAVDGDETDFITEANTEMILVKSRSDEFSKTTESLLAAFYELKREK